MLAEWNNVLFFYVILVYFVLWCSWFVYSGKKQPQSKELEIANDNGMGGTVID